MVEQQPAGCFVCDKHKGGISVPGGAIYEDELVYVSHASIPEGQSTGYLGSLLVEPRRDVSNLGGLTDIEAQRAGLLVAWLSRVLESQVAAEHVYVFVLGHEVVHLHVWVVPRCPAAPQEYWGIRVDEWPEGPRGGPEETAELCDRIRRHLEGEAGPATTSR